MENHPIMTLGCTSTRGRPLPQIFPQSRLSDTEGWWGCRNVDVDKHIEVLVVIRQWRRYPEGLGRIEETGGWPFLSNHEITSHVVPGSDRNSPFHVRDQFSMPLAPVPYRWRPGNEYTVSGRPVTHPRWRTRWRDATIGNP